MNNHFHHVLAFQELDMGGSPNKTVQVRLLNPEVNVDSVNHLDWKFIQNVLSHLNVNVTIFSKQR